MEGRGSAGRSEGARTRDGLQVTRAGWEKQGAVDHTLTDSLEMRALVTLGVRSKIESSGSVDGDQRCLGQSG